MPSYEYACKSCGRHFEVQQAFTDDALTTCPTCGGPLRKVFGNIAISFKGSGFYSTDNRSVAKAGGSAKGDGDHAAASSDGASKAQSSNAESSKAESSKAESSKAEAGGGESKSGGAREAKPPSKAEAAKSSDASKASKAPDKSAAKTP